MEKRTRSEVIVELNKILTAMVSKEGDPYAMVMHLRNKLMMENVVLGIKRRQSREVRKQKERIKKMYGIK